MMRACRPATLPKSNRNKHLRQQQHQHSQATSYLPAVQALQLQSAWQLQLAQPAAAQRQLLAARQTAQQQLAACPTNMGSHLRQRSSCWIASLRQHAPRAALLVGLLGVLRLKGVLAVVMLGNQALLCSRAAMVLMDSGHR